VAILVADAVPLSAGIHPHVVRSLHGSGSFHLTVRPSSGGYENTQLTFRRVLGWTHY